MMANRCARRFQLLDADEHRSWRSLNRGLQRPLLRNLRVVVGRLGDGIAWYRLVLPMASWRGEAGLKPALVMAATGTAGVGLYKRSSSTAWCASGRTA